MTYNMWFILCRFMILVLQRIYGLTSNSTTNYNIVLNLVEDIHKSTTPTGFKELKEE